MNDGTKEITDGQKDLAFALGEMAREQNNKKSSNPFKKKHEHYHWWIIGFECRDK